MNEQNIENACEVFLSRCIALNLANGTLAWYENILRELRRSLSGQGVERLEQVGAEHLRAYLTMLRRTGHASETVFRTYGAIRSAPFGSGSERAS